ncbi:trace amine-associated receptor 4-like [Protopterus annectens]|uniref:trace amine-associated receptor 4-like n=1 Tax=Protopterus annectens TaxID=7888 RepID=UPI001CFADE42|nr:trace amine-associated receptor 4-like [Protopterus annectens]
MSSPKDTEYCFSSVNDSCIKSTRTTLTHTVLYICVISCMLTILCGNLVVIISISHFKQLHSPTNVLVCSLAVVDFLVGFLIIPYSMIRSIESCWYFGSEFCKVHTSFDLMLCTSSVFHLGFIAIDRYYAVCDALRYFAKMTFSTVILFVIISWICPALVSFGVVLSQIGLLGTDDYFASNNCTGLCIMLFNKIWVVFNCTLLFIVPAMVMVCIYIKIFVVAKRHARAVVNQNDRSGKSKLHISRNKESKAAKTLSIVMGTFIICWLPTIVLNIRDSFLNYSTPAVLLDVSAWLAYFNSGFNPIIYGFFYPWFRKSLNIILSGKIFSPNSSAIRLFIENK